MLCKPCKGKKFFIAIQPVYFCSESEDKQKFLHNANRLRRTNITFAETQI